MSFGGFKRKENSIAIYNSKGWGFWDENNEQNKITCEQETLVTRLDSCPKHSYRKIIKFATVIGKPILVA